MRKTENILIKCTKSNMRMIAAAAHLLDITPTEYTRRSAINCAYGDLQNHLHGVPMDDDDFPEQYNEIDELVDEVLDERILELEKLKNL